MNNTFYVLATNDEGKHFVIDNLPNNRIEARILAEDHCKKHNLIFQEIRPVENKKKQGEIMVKHLKEEKRLRSQRGYKPQKMSWFF